jgi:quinol monooxygenase YgiN
MPKLIEMDAHVTLMEQMGDTSGGPVVLINKFDVIPAEAEQFLEAWRADATVMKGQPGLIWAQLHRGIGGSGVFVNCALWESTALFKQAFTSPEFQARMRDYPPSATASPHLFRKIAVPGICVA